MESANWEYKLAALINCEDKENIPFDIIQKGLDCENDHVKYAAVGLCKDRGDVLIEEWLKYDNWSYRAATDLIQIGMNDESEFVRDCCATKIKNF